MESSGSDAGATASAAAVEKRRKEEEVVRVLRRVEARSRGWFQRLRPFDLNKSPIKREKPKGLSFLLY